MRVTGLYVYPLKSARGLPLEEANLDAFGIEGDRRWCLTGGDGRVITQRDCPVLATLDVWGRLLAYHDEVEDLVGQTGTALNPLRPAGKARKRRNISHIPSLRNADRRDAWASKM